MSPGDFSIRISGWVFMSVPGALDGPGPLFSCLGCADRLATWHLVADGGRARGVFGTANKGSHHSQAFFVDGVAAVEFELFVEQVCLIEANHLDNTAGDLRAFDTHFRDGALLLLIGEGEGESGRNGVARLFATYLDSDGTKLAFRHGVPGSRVN